MLKTGARVTIARRKYASFLVIADPYISWKNKRKTFLVMKKLKQSEGSKVITRGVWVRKTEKFLPNFSFRCRSPFRSIHELIIS